MSDNENSPELATRVDDLAEKVDRLAEMVAKILPGSHAAAQSRTEAKLDQASSVEEQVRAELARAEAERQKSQAETAEKDDVKSRLAKLEEKPPAQPTPRRTKLLGWGDPR